MPAGRTRSPAVTVRRKAFALRPDSLMWVQGRAHLDLHLAEEYSGQLAESEAEHAQSREVSAALGECHARVVVDAGRVKVS